MKLVKGNVTIGVQTRFGPNWPGIRCLAKTRRGTECQRAAYKHNRRCALHGGLSTGARTQEGLQRISEANIKHGRQTKDKLAAQRHVAKVGRQGYGRAKAYPTVDSGCGAYAGYRTYSITASRMTSGLVLK